MNFRGAAKPLSHAGLTSALAAIDFAQGEAALANFRLSQGLPASNDIDAATFERLRSELGWQ